MDFEHIDLNNLNNNTILELRAFGKAIGVKSVTRHKKQKLIQLIEERLQEVAAEQQEQMQLEGKLDLESDQKSSQKAQEEVSETVKETEEDQKEETEKQEDSKVKPFPVSERQTKTTPKPSPRKEKDEDDNLDKVEETLQREKQDEEGYDSDYERKVAYARKYYNTSNPAIPELLNQEDTRDAEGVLETLPDGYEIGRAHV